MSNPPNALRKKAGKLPLKSINPDLAADYNLTECRLPSPSRECIPTIPTGAVVPLLSIWLILGAKKCCPSKQCSNSRGERGGKEHGSSRHCCELFLLIRECSTQLTPPYPKSRVCPCSCDLPHCPISSPLDCRHLPFLLLMGASSKNRTLKPASSVSKPAAA